MLSPQAQEQTNEVSMTLQVGQSIKATHEIELDSIPLFCIRKGEIAKVLRLDNGRQLFPHIAVYTAEGKTRRAPLQPSIKDINAIFGTSFEEEVFCPKCFGSGEVTHSRGNHPSIYTMMMCGKCGGQGKVKQGR